MSERISIKGKGDELFFGAGETPNPSPVGEQDVARQTDDLLPRQTDTNPASETARNTVRQTARQTDNSRASESRPDLVGPSAIRKPRSTQCVTLSTSSK